MSSLPGLGLGHPPGLGVGGAPGAAGGCGAAAVPLGYGPPAFGHGPVAPGGSPIGGMVPGGLGGGFPGGHGGPFPFGPAGAGWSGARNPSGPGGGGGVGGPPPGQGSDPYSSGRWSGSLLASHKRQGPEMYFQIRASTSTVREWVVLFLPGNRQSQEWADLYGLAESIDLTLQAGYASYGLPEVYHLLSSDDHVLALPPVRGGHLRSNGRAGHAGTVAGESAPG